MNTGLKDLRTERRVKPAGPRGIRIALYLGLCAGTGVIVGRAFGAFARLPFHYPARPEAVSSAHRALVDALEAVEFPALFGLTLACALVLWAWIVPRHATRRAGWRATALLLASCTVAGASIAADAADRPGRTLAAIGGATLGALAAAMLTTFWREAAEAGRSMASRWSSQVPPAAGHLAATSAAALSLGYRGENSLIQGFALIVGIGIFCAELTLALIVGALGRRLEGSQNA